MNVRISIKPCIVYRNNIPYPGYKIGIKTPDDSIIKYTQPMTKSELIVLRKAIKDNLGL